MALSHFNPTKVRLLRCHVKGVDLKLHVNCIRVFEDMCKPYITAQIMIMDNNNIINGLKLEGGDPVSFAIDSHENNGDVYEQQQYILSIDGEESTDNLRTITYTIYTAGLSYFKDKANLVQMSAVNVTGSSLAARIHNEYVSDGGLSVHSSSGMIAKDDIGGYHINNKHPFKAIGDVLDRSVGSGTKTGSWMYFRDRFKHVICPLETIFGQMGSQKTFWQLQFGTVFEHTLQGADPRAQHDKPSNTAIIAAKTVVKELPNVSGGRGGGGNIASAAKGAMNMFDVADGKSPLQSSASAGSGGNIGGSSALGSVSRFATGKFGGIQNVLQNDCRRNPLSVNQGINAVAENSFQASVKDATHYLVKVPFQSGISVTIGKGATAHLTPPFGDVPGGTISGSPLQRVGGQMLAARVMHECYFDQRLVQGTTTMELVAGFKG